MRFLNADDEEVLDAAFRRCALSRQAVDAPCSLWTKCDGVFADYFLKNWKERKEPLAFLLYDPPPALESGAPVFIHADKAIRLVAMFREGQYVAGYKLTVAEVERVAERERIWSTYREATVDPPSKSDFDAFWESQHGIRGLFVMDEIVELPTPVTFKAYGRALGWGYPMGVGYRYLSFSQSYLLLRSAKLPRRESRDLLKDFLTKPS